MSHNLFKVGKGWECSLCCWQWQSKPTTGCPGVPRYGYGAQPSHLKSRIELDKSNLIPPKGTKASGCIYLYAKKTWILLFDEKSCLVKDPDLPPVVQWSERGDLKTIGQLKKLNLAPKQNIEPRGVGWVYDSEEEEGKWISLYHVDDCEWSARDNFLTKTTLKKVYLLSEGWIKKLGEADKKLENIKYRNAHPTQLFSRQRVEKFLAENAEEYAKWLDKRDKHLAIFEANKDKIFARRNLVKAQTQACLTCASGISTQDGFLCAIHPMGLDDFPCFDWISRVQS